MGKIVWLASYPKSGNTWLRILLHNFLRDAVTPHGINALTDLCPVECAAAFFSRAGLTEQKTQAERPSVHQRLTGLRAGPVFLKTHNANLALHGVPLCTPEFTEGAIYIVRDPRDVALSYAAFSGRRLEDIVADMANEHAAIPGDEAQVFEFLSSWSGHARSWVAAPKRILLRYEDMLAAPEKNFARVIRFLTGSADEARVRRAVAHSRFTEAAAQERAQGFRAGGRGAGAFFRKGVSGQWKTEMPSALREKIEGAHGEIMKGFGYL